MPEVDALKSVIERPLCRNNYIYPRTASRQAIRAVRQAGRQAVGRMGGRGGSSWAAVAVRPYPPRPPAPRPTHPRPPPHALAKPQNGRR